MQQSPVDGDGSLVSIRPFQPGDAAAIYQAIQESQADLSPWMPDLGGDLSLQDITNWLAARPGVWATGSAYDFAIIDSGNDRLLGGCGLTHINRQHRFANLYYWVRSSRARRGVATAATRLLARFGFETLELRRVEIVVAAENAASVRVAVKVGATREGLLRNRITIRGTSHDALMFSLIPSDLV